MSLRRDSSCSKFKIATESSLDSVWTLPKHSTKRRFPLCNHKRNGRRMKILYNQDLQSSFLFGLQNVGFLFPCKKWTTATSTFKTYLLFWSGEKKKLIHCTWGKFRLFDVLSTRLLLQKSIPCCFQFAKHTLFSKVPLVITIQDCQTVIFSYQFPLCEFQLPSSFSARYDRMVGVRWVKAGMWSPCGKGCSTYLYCALEDTKSGLMEMRRARGEVLSTEVCGKQDSLGCTVH